MLVATKNQSSRISAPNWRRWSAIPLTLMLLVSCTPASIASEKQTLIRTLTVSGRGVEEIPATLAQVNVGVEIQGKNVQEVQQEAAKRSSAVVSLLKSRNVEKLQTAGISLSPIYSYTNNVQKITGYSATNSVSFRIATDKAGPLLDEVVKVGATRIQGISFVASDEAISQAQKVALQKATQDAREQSNAVFSALNIQPKEIVSIQINNATPPQPIYREFAKVSVQMADAAPTPVEGGQQWVEASVTLQISY